MKLLTVISILSLYQISFAGCDESKARPICKNEVERTLNTKLSSNTIRMTFQYFTNPETDYGTTECHYYVKSKNIERMGVVQMVWETCEVGNHLWSDLKGGQ